MLRNLFFSMLLITVLSLGLQRHIPLTVEDRSHLIGVLG